MNYNDDSILSVEQYGVIAKAYTDALKERRLKIINITDEIEEKEIDEILNKLFSIKSLLLCLGGFLNTSAFYSLNERQLKKILIIFDQNDIIPVPVKERDKTKCFLRFLSTEFGLLHDLINLAHKTNFEHEIKNIINERLLLLSKILAL